MPVVINPTVASGSQPAPPKPKKYVASLIHPHGFPSDLPTEFAEAVLELEKLLGMPVWLFVQDGSDKHAMCGHIEDMFFEARHKLPQTPVALLIESPGGQPDCAYRIAKLLQRRCGSFTAVIANWAKSAATLLALGASEIVIAEQGQLGPLDVQISDPEREDDSFSALNETQALSRLHLAGLEALVNTLYVLKDGTGKRVSTLLPHALKFVADSMRPLYENIDVVQYTTRLRDLKIAEEYATRLLLPNYPPKAAAGLARRLVEAYPDHGFVVDLEEAKRIGIRGVREPTLAQAEQLDKIAEHIRDLNAFGRVEEV